MEPFVLALGLGMVGLAGDRFDAEGLQVGDEQAFRLASSGGVERGPVVGQEALGHAVEADAFLDDAHRVARVLASGGQGGDGQAGVVVDDLQDHAGAAAGQRVVGAVDLPAGVRCGIDESAP